MEIKVGCKVEVVNSGSTYSAYDEKAKELKLKRWIPNRSPSDGTFGKVISIAGHHAGISTPEGEFVMGIDGLKIISSSYKLKVPTHVVIWDEESRDPSKFFTSESEANDFIKELSEKSNVIKNSILLIQIKSCKKVVIEKRLRYKEHKI